MTKTLSLTFSSSLSDLTSKNSSFDQGILRVAYTNANRNGSYISKDTYERCISSIYNCPIVCNYDRETDSIGAHDIDLVQDDDGSIRMVNATTPLGVVPESAHYYWQNVTEDDGSEHEYLCVEVLLWKRQEAYKKVKEDGIVAESMEITVKNGWMENGIYVIDSFEFTAFCLLGDAEPCFESASLEVFSREAFREQYHQMMTELKNENSLRQLPDNGAEINYSNTKGVNDPLNEKLEMISKFGLTAEQLNFSIDELSLDELEAKLNECKENYSLLASQLREQLWQALNAVRVETTWGEMNRYCYCDHSTEPTEVYCWDVEDDWNLYGFPYSLNGDTVVIDFEQKTRKKYAIVDFVEGEAPQQVGEMFNKLTEAFSQKVSQLESELSSAKADAEQKSAEFERVNTEAEELRKFKQERLDADRAAELDAVFSIFEDLSGTEAFEELRNNCSEMTVEEVEGKCYELRGRNANTGAAKFSLDKAPKLKVTKRNTENEPYGGVFEKYGIAKND